MKLVLRFKSKDLELEEKRGMDKPTVEKVMECVNDFEDSLPMTIWTVYAWMDQFKDEDEYVISYEVMEERVREDLKKIHVEKSDDGK